MKQVSTFVLPLLMMLLSCGNNKSYHATTAAQEGYVESTNGVRIFYRLRGSGSDTLVIIHGGPGFTMDYFLEDLTPLADNHTLIFYDQRGTGRSTLVNDSVSLSGDRFVEDLEALRQHFRLAKLNLFGHSWGSGVVALYAAAYPDNLGKLIISGALPLRQHQLADAFRKLEAGRDSFTLRRMNELKAARLADPSDADVCRQYYTLWFDGFFGDSAAATRSKGDFCAGTAESRRNKMLSVDRFTMASLGQWDWRPALSRVQAQTLLIQGTKDPLPVEFAEAWSSILPNARLMVLQEVGHFPYLEVPNQFFKAVDQFLEEK